MNIKVVLEGQCFHCTGDKFENVEEYTDFMSDAVMTSKTSGRPLSIPMADGRRVLIPSKLAEKCAFIIGNE